MHTASTVAELREQVQGARASGRRVALVPTMGNLHEGHLTLIDRARREADFVVASIFVNPLQFGPGEDLDAYPRTLERDRGLLAERGTDLVFQPDESDMYPNGRQRQTLVAVPELGNDLCGAARPGHFDGVTTVVTKLFNLVQPDVAVFGQKDYQQLAIIRKMTEDLCLPIEIIGVKTARADDGLALSSRNGYLTEEERTRAPALRAALERMAHALASGDGDFAALEAGAVRALTDAGFRPDYVSIRARDLSPPAPEADDLVVLAAAHLGKARLIDNIEVDRP